ncbi:hypothetical protein L1987_67948 [Smallanthus sonchifolius]|uniref:Uncharacterized protein n=1 Tax=Smallanthus sonchifolius TaxID=185202 RepID=A0ACB9B3N0_9ASTR|nr:hypothetical protein L1987_67948 [Smallanthus sonchifolius]
MEVLDSISHNRLSKPDAVLEHIGGFCASDCQVAGLNVFSVQDLIPYKTIDGLEIAKDQIEEALKVVCKSHKLALAQVWIAHKDKSHVLMSSSLGDTQMNQLLAIKLTGCLYAVTDNYYNYDFGPYFRLCDTVACDLILGSEFVIKTLQDYESRHISKLRSNNLELWGDREFFSACSALAICLRSNDTGDFNYAFEFIWINQANYVILLEDILLTLKRCLPRFKFASGEELVVIAVETATYREDDEDNTATDNETSEIGESVKLKIFERKRSSPVPKALEEGNKAVVVDYYMRLTKKHTYTRNT